MINLVKDFESKDRRALAKIITLVESDAPSSRLLVQKIVSALRKPSVPSIRVAISGPPGVGKSTFINTLGQKIIKRGFRLAILPIDPASELSGGSILADKTRMGDLINDEDVFIRPSSSRGALGGINVAMSDVIFVVESFGFDFVIIETIGVGQAEVLAHTLADHFVVLMQPGSGDVLQAMKKGILEFADFVLVNKADGEFLPQAKQSYYALHQALPPATHLALVSALDGTGLDDFVNAVLSAHADQKTSGKLLAKRRERLEGFFEFALQERLFSQLLAHPTLNKRRRMILDRVSTQHDPLGPLLDQLCAEIVAGLKNF